MSKYYADISFTIAFPGRFDVRQAASHKLPNHYHNMVGKKTCCAQMSTRNKKNDVTKKKNDTNSVIFLFIYL
jgi:hypothetical protein